MVKRILIFIICICLLLSILIVPAFATSYSVNSTISFSYPNGSNSMNLYYSENLTANQYINDVILSTSPIQATQSASNTDYKYSFDNQTYYSYFASISGHQPYASINKVRWNFVGSFNAGNSYQLLPDSNDGYFGFKVRLSNAVSTVINTTNNSITLYRGNSYSNSVSQLNSYFKPSVFIDVDYGDDFETVDVTDFFACNWVGSYNGIYTDYTLQLVPNITFDFTTVINGLSFYIQFPDNYFYTYNTNSTGSQVRLLEFVGCSFPHLDTPLSFGSTSGIDLSPITSTLDDLNESVSTLQSSIDNLSGDNSPLVSALYDLETTVNSIYTLIDSALFKTFTVTFQSGTATYTHYSIAGIASDIEQELIYVRNYLSHIALYLNGTESSLLEDIYDAINSVSDSLDDIDSAMDTVADDFSDVNSDLSNSEDSVYSLVSDESADFDVDVSSAMALYGGSAGNTFHSLFSSFFINFPWLLSITVIFLTVFLAKKLLF